jgi:hypothetical protein
MRTRLLVIAVLALTVFAQAETFEAARFAPPPGWKADRNSGRLIYTTIDEAAGTYCLLGVYASTPSKGAADLDFSAEWEAIVRNGFTGGPAPRPLTGKTAAGLSYLAGGAEASQGGVPSHVRLYVFPAGARVMSVMVVATDAAALAAREGVLRAFLDSLRIDGAGAAPAATAPSSPASTNRGPSGLTVPTPENWQRADADGVVKLERIIDLGWNLKNEFRMVFSAPMPAGETPLATFTALYPQFAGAAFASVRPPLPLRVRLKSGAVLLFDGGDVRLRSGDGELTGVVYVLVQGGMAVAAIGTFVGWNETLDATLREVFEGVRIAGASGKNPPLFSRNELAGKWRSSNTGLASYVDAGGNYRGDASLSTSETLTLGADGNFRSFFAAIGSRTMRIETSGPWTVEDDTLVMRGKERTDRYRITGVGRSADGKGSFLLLSITRSDYPALSLGSGVSRAGDLYVGVRD